VSETVSDSASGGISGRIDRAICLFPTVYCRPFVEVRADVHGDRVEEPTT
jgi:hypothetical protein